MSVMPCPARRNPQVASDLESMPPMNVVATEDRSPAAPPAPAAPSTRDVPSRVRSRAKLWTGLAAFVVLGVVIYTLRDKLPSAHSISTARDQRQPALGRRRRRDGSHLDGDVRPAAAGVAAGHVGTHVDVASDRCHVRPIRDRDQHAGRFSGVRRVRLPAVPTQRRQRATPPPRSSSSPASCRSSAWPRSISRHLRRRGRARRAQVVARALRPDHHGRRGARRGHGRSGRPCAAGRVGVPFHSRHGRDGGATPRAYAGGPPLRSRACGATWRPGGPYGPGTGRWR